MNIFFDFVVSVCLVAYLLPFDQVRTQKKTLSLSGWTGRFLSGPQNIGKKTLQLNSEFLEFFDAFNISRDFQNNLRKSRISRIIRRSYHAIQ